MFHPLLTIAPLRNSYTKGSKLNLFLYIFLGSGENSQSSFPMHEKTPPHSVRIDLGICSSILGKSLPEIKKTSLFYAQLRKKEANSLSIFSLGSVRVPSTSNKKQIFDMDLFICR